MHVSIALVYMYNAIQSDFKRNGEADKSSFVSMYVYALDIRKSESDELML